MVTALAAGCGGGTQERTGSGSKADSAGAAKAATVVAAAKRRDGVPPPLSPNPAVKGKQLAIIVFSQANESGYVPSNAAKQAAETIGWKATIYDAKGNVGAITGLVRQATAAGAQAIIVVNIDCALAPRAFRQAKSAGVLLVPINGFDCDDSGASGGVSPSGFSGQIKPGGGLTADQFWMQDGSDMAQMAIADSGDTAKIISIEATGLAVEIWQQRGFDSTIKASGGSKIVDKIDFTFTDFLSGRLTTMVQSALTQHPEATYIKSPFSAATIANVVPAVRASHSDIKILGGEGLQSELDLLRGGKILATDTTPAAWSGWAAVDTLNSLFRKAKPNDSGLQWVLVTKENVPPSGPVRTADYETAYRKAWGLA